MEASDIVQNGGLVVSGALVTKIGDWLMSWIRARGQKTEISPSPLEIEKKEKFVTRGEFNNFVSDNARDHENMFSRLNRNDRETSEMSGTLKAIREDVTLIKNKLFRTTRS